MVVSVSVHRIVFRKAHSSAKHVDCKDDYHEHQVLAEPFRGICLITEENAECRGKTETDEISKTVELSSEIRTGVH